MNNLKYWERLTSSEKIEFSESLGLSKAYVSNVIHGNVSYSVEKAKEMAANSGGKLTVRFLVNNLIDRS